jgi:two-component system response regulator (stage 0 sporulation protein F)
VARILVIDDEPRVLALLRDALELAGHGVATASDARLGLQFYRNDPADLVILDVYMPTRDGLGVMIELLSEFPDARIIAMSGAVGLYDPLVDADALGAARTLRKPFGVPAVLAAVRDVLERAA